MRVYAYSDAGVKRAMSVLLGLVSTAVSILDLMALHWALRGVSAAVVKTDPYHVVESTYQAVWLEWMGLILVAMVWLAAVILFFWYYGQAQTRRVLFRRFLKVTLIEGVILVVGYLLPSILF